MALPKLRFKEFGSGWNSIAIGTFLKIKSGLGFKAEEYTTAEEIRLLQIENVGYGTVKWTHNVKYVPSDYLKLHEGLVLKEGDLVLALNRPVTNDQLKIAKLTKQDSPSILYQRVGKLEFIKEEFDSNFIFQIFQKDVKNYVLNSSLGSDQPFISTTDLYKYKLCLPSKEEQTKIASFLSTVDEKIAQLTQKHELLSQYKQGMMQKLFSQQIRFKADDGSEFGEWETLKFKDLINIKYGKDHKKLGDGNIPVLGTGGIMRYVDSYLYDGESILIGRKGTINKPQFISGKFWTVDTLFYTEIGKKILPKFAFQQLLLVNWLNLNEATGVPSLNTSSIGNIEIKVPCLDEQTKIANFLSAIDQKIEVVVKQIEQAKQWKKGLLQQMFV
ncbi:restriction endonuclease subunit S [Acinetobacter oleivorans]|uniref:restriction endonuclease subunit S n=1 Tax=Acinetobacter oleivorans TaxID=1148157 RepID=UPI002B25B304|nr:restriction endonuclease subunit S [Acinetobacter oleivorans]WQF72055.1 restriction endonuclease subunit S [Acinetobacter oleivorans]